MKILFFAAVAASVSVISVVLIAQTSQSKPKKLYIDVHRLEPGKVKFEDVAKAHAQDLATQKKYGVQFIKYWVDEAGGTVYCLSSASDTESIRKTHAEAHGLLPAATYEVSDGVEASPLQANKFFLDIHNLGAGNVTAKDVAEAHKKDLAVQKKYGVNFVNYWVNEKDGIVVCLSQAKDSGDIIRTHKEAHGLLPDQVMRVKQGQ